MNEFEREPIGYLIISEYLKVAIYKPINRFHRLMMKLWLGWTYEPCQKGDKEEYFGGELYEGEFENR